MKETRKERQKDEDNYQKIIEFAESLRPGSSRRSGRLDQREKSDRGNREIREELIREEETSMTLPMAAMNLEEEDHHHHHKEISGRGNLDDVTDGGHEPRGNLDDVTDGG